MGKVMFLWTRFLPFFRRKILRSRARGQGSQPKPIISRSLPIISNGHKFSKIYCMRYMYKFEHILYLARGALFKLISGSEDKNKIFTRTATV
jgi:hypothetical protein